MQNFTNTVEEWVLNWFRGINMTAAPAALYVGLFSSDPTDSGVSGTEITTAVNASGRLTVIFGAPTQTGSNGAARIQNSDAVNFGAAANNATITHIGIFDAQTAGRLLAYAPLGVPMPVITGNPVQFAAGALGIELD